ncbi:hypothetical protein J7L68_09230 [bacterium]|nr:hypothetical protein [bacterium]
MDIEILKKTIELLPDGILAKNNDGNIILSNELGLALQNRESDDDDFIELDGKYYKIRTKKISDSELIIWHNVTELRKTRDLMVIDPDTGAFNEVFMREELERELDRVHRTGSQMALVLIDIDCGEDGPSKKEIVSVLKKTIRNYDMLFDGDRSDFVLMLFAVNVDKIYITGERILKTLKDLNISRVSIGITLSEKAPSAEAMMRQAQRALYVVNARGGNDFSIY